MSMSDTSSAKKADVASGAGALATGLGLGLLLPEQPDGLAVAVLAGGAATHAWGMWRKHSVERQAGPPPRWSEALYWICWLTLAGLAVLLLARAVV